MELDQVYVLVVYDFYVHIKLVDIPNSLGRPEGYFWSSDSRDKLVNCGSTVGTHTAITEIYFYMDVYKD